MEYIIIIILNFISCTILIANGTLFKSLFNFNQQNDVIENGLYGLILVSLLTFTFNFFFEISKNLSLFLFFFPFFLIFKKIYFLKNEILKKSILVSLISSLIMFLENSNRPDAGLYHLPFINIINDSKLIFGSANLEFRYGHTSVLQYLAAGFNNIVFTEKGISIPLANIFGFTTIYIFNLYNKNEGIFKVIIFLFLFNILYSMNRYSGFGNDDPAHIFFYLVFCNFLLFIKNKNNDYKKNIIFFSTFVFLIKPFLILVFLIPLYLFISKEIKLFSKTNIFCSIVIVLWFVKNIFISSCIIYPEPKLCFTSLKWSTINSKISNPSRVKRTSEAWAKDWPNKKGNISQEDYIKDFNWLNTWKKNHFKIVINEILPQILIILVILFIFPFEKEIFKLNRKDSLIIFIFSFVCVTLWFLKFPIYRYGQSYIILLLNSIFILALNLKFRNLNKNYNFFNKFLTSILIILSIGIISKNLIRIYKNYNNFYVDYPWPKINSYTTNNEKNKNIKVYSNKGKFLYYKPSPYTLCMSSTSPCTSNIDVKNIKLEHKFGYKIYYYE